MSNYVEMWKDLGMDLDTHDQLCQVLPSAFGDVYLSQENRPEGMDFIMNDKCSAGTGRFLEVMANTMGVDLNTMCDLAARGSGVTISSMCTVFAESEVISLIGRGESRENIAFAVVDSIVKKVTSQASHLDHGDMVCLTGGLCQVEYVQKALGAALKHEITAHENGRYAGAIGAALAAQSVKKKKGAQQ